MVRQKSGMRIENCIVMKHFCVNGGALSQKTDKVSEMGVRNILGYGIVTIMGAMLMSGLYFSIL